MILKNIESWCPVRLDRWVEFFLVNTLICALPSIGYFPMVDACQRHNRIGQFVDLITLTVVLPRTISWSLE